MARQRRQSFTFGDKQAVRTGVPTELGDVYYRLMEMSWAAFCAVIALTFLLVNLLFGIVYASLPGVIANAAPGSLADAFFFSVETLATVGYGNMAPANHLGHSIAVAEIMLGLFMMATTTGLIFSRFARPRDGLLFSNVLTVGPIGPIRVLAVRVAGIRARPLADVVAHLALIERVALSDGRHFRRLTDLPLFNDRNALMGLAWTIAHPLDDSSPVKQLIETPGADIRLLLTVNGLDTLLAAPFFGSRMYTRADMRFEHGFTDIIEERDDGTIHVDLSRIAETRMLSPKPKSN